ncbi:MAG: bacteriocin [Alphaproteobacteria bacterium]|nr:bacteriocin [Alphaproteobacteria bacterium]
MIKKFKTTDKEITELTDNELNNVVGGKTYDHYDYESCVEVANLTCKGLDAAYCWAEQEYRCRFKYLGADLEG